MGETYTQMLNRNFRAAYGDENASRNSTCKYFVQGTNELMPKVREEPDVNGDTLYNHNGRDLTEVFQAEIMDFDTPWNWIQDRIDNENFTGLMIGDYIPLTIDEKDWQAVIIGINTYKGFGATGKTVGTHIDFWLVSEESNYHVYNNVNNNNSKDADTPYWWTSEMYAWLNALKIDVVNNTAAPMTLEEVDHTEDGFLLSLPEALQALIVDRYGPLAGRYSSGSMGTSDGYAFWDNCGKLWLLNPAEITGNMLYSPQNSIIRYELHYPYFIGNPNRRRATRYWTMGAYTNSTGFVLVEDQGRVNGLTASNTTVSAYPCFRLAPTPEETP